MKIYLHLIQYRYRVSYWEGEKLLKFLHIADVHLDTSFYSKKEDLRKKLRDGIRKSFSNAIDLCINERVNALLIAGDLFDNDKLSFKTEQFLVNEFRRLDENDINVFYATGNHDPGHLSYRANSIKWPDNVYLFNDDSIKVIDIKNPLGEVIYSVVSCGHKTNNEGRNLVKEFPHKEGNLPYIGVLHTMVTNVKGAENHDRYLPCSREDLESKDYDYWALGHIHKRQKIGENAEIYYPGNIQGRHPRETGKKGGLLISIDKNNSIDIDFRPLSTIEWSTISISGLDDIKEYTELKDYIGSQIKDHIRTNRLINRELLLRVELQGRAYLKEELKSQENIDEFAYELNLDLDLLDLEIKTDALLGVIDIKDYEEGNHVLALVLELLKDMDGNEELLNRLLDTHLINKGIRKRDEKAVYIKKLLKGMDEVALSYMAGDKYED